MVSMTRLPTIPTVVALLGYFTSDITSSFPLISPATILTRRETLSTIPLTAAMASNSNGTSIRWGIIGLGDVCTKKAGPAFYKCNGSELVAVNRRTPGKAKEFANQVPGGKCVGYETIDEFLGHPDGLDAVYVSTRPGTHLDICMRVAAAGMACYVEKPVGRCAMEAEKIVEVFRKAGLPLYTAYISRAYDRTQTARKLLRDGEIGDTITSVSYRLVGSGGARDMEGKLPWRLDASQSGGGLLMDVGCHVVDRIDYICGPLVDVQGTAQNRNSNAQNVEDYVHFTAKVGESIGAVMPNTRGASVECTWDFGSMDEVDACDTLLIVGSKGSMMMDGTKLQVFDPEGNVQQDLNFPLPEHTAQQLIQAVTDDLRGVGKSDVLSYGINAIRTQKVLDTCLTSYYGGREIGYWDRSQSWPGLPKR